MEKLKFLSGIPRSGSTLLTSLLNQRPDTYAGNTSNLADMLVVFDGLWETRGVSVTAQTDGLKKEECIEVLKQYRYGKIARPIIFDKSTAWPYPKTIEFMMRYQSEVKIVATVRPINECIASAYKLIATNEETKDSEHIKRIIGDSQFKKYILESYHRLYMGYDKYPDKFLLIEYSDLVSKTQEQMDRISDFIGVEKFTHDINNVAPSGEEDFIWGIKDLHKVRPEVAKQEYSPKELLGDELWEEYSGGEFWNDIP